MNIRQKLRSSLLLLMLAFVSMVSTIAYTFHTVHGATAYLTQVNNVIRMVFELSMLGYEYQAHHEERSVTQWQSIYDRLGEHLTAFAGAMTGPEDDDMLRSMRENHRLIGTLFETTMAQESSPEAVRLSVQSLMLRSSILVADAHRLTEASNRRVAARTAQLLLIVLASLLPSSLACVFIVLAHRRILTSLKTLHAGASTIGQGHLTQTIPVTGQDEFALLAQILNTMAAQVHTDIAQRAEAQTQLQHYIQQLAETNDQLAHFAVMVESSTDAIISLTLEGHIVSWNAGAEQLYGYTFPEVQGRHQALLVPADRSHELPHMLDLIRRGAPVLPYETVRLRKDGTPRDVSVSLSPLHDTAGQVTGAVAIVRDMTERRWAREQFHGLLEATPDAMVIINQAGDIVLVNARTETLFGYTRQELLGQAVELLLPERLRQVHTRHRHTYTSAPSVRPMGGSSTLYALHRDGHEFPVEVSLTPIKTAEGLLISSVIRDVTARRQAETALAQALHSLTEQNQLLTEARDQALQATRAKTAFLATMSHEIRTPMNAILGMADLLEECAFNPEQQDYVARFKKAGVHLLTLINDILDLSKIEAGHLELEHVPFDLAELLQTVSELMASRAHAKGLELLYWVAPHLPTSLIGDPHRLRQILVNLLSNAIKFTATGEVFLQVTREDERLDRLRFAIRDTGIGIPGEKLATIFENFTQADTSTTRQYGGTGLGLSICTHLVGLMGGQLTVESEVGRGSTFVFTAQFALDSSPVTSVLIPPVDLHGRHVLVIDDNATNRLLVRKMVLAHGGLVTEVEGAEAGLRAVEEAQQGQRRFDVILVDGQMPDKDGFYFLEEFRKIYTTDTAVLLMLASDTHPGDRARCRTLGVAQYLLKPIARAALLQVMAQALGQRQHAVSSRQADPLTCELRPNRALKLLIADDNEDNQMLLRTYLKNTSHQLTMVNNGASAVEQFMADAYDLVLMDVQMPIMDGYSATASIRQWEQAQQRPPTRILALTAHALTEDHLKSQAAGCDGHLTKPIRKATLLQAIEECARSLACPA